MLANFPCFSWSLTLEKSRDKFTLVNSRFILPLAVPTTHLSFQIWWKNENSALKIHQGRKMNKKKPIMIGSKYFKVNFYGQNTWLSHLCNQDLKRIFLALSTHISNFQVIRIDMLTLKLSFAQKRAKKIHFHLDICILKIK